MKQISTVVQVWDEGAQEVTGAMGYDAEKMASQFSKLAISFLKKVNDGSVKNVADAVYALSEEDETFFQFIFTSGLLDFFRNVGRASAEAHRIKGIIEKTKEEDTPNE